jgi:methylmalonyl-CoA mutase N-terminal domain/subunit
MPQPRASIHAKSGANLISPIFAAAEALATVSEIADTLRAVFGGYRETVTVTV